MKGADVVMQTIVQYNDWLDEEVLTCVIFCGSGFLTTSHLQCGNMAREGLRTLVVAKKTLSAETYNDFEVCG